MRSPYWKVNPNKAKKISFFIANSICSSAPDDTAHKGRTDAVSLVLNTSILPIIVSLFPADDAVIPITRTGLRRYACLMSRSRNRSGSQSELITFEMLELFD
jgi:hypothetical protein